MTQFRRAAHLPPPSVYQPRLYRSLMHYSPNMEPLTGRIAAPTCHNRVRYCHISIHFGPIHRFLSSATRSARPRRRRAREPHAGVHLGRRSVQRSLTARRYATLTR